MDDFEIIDTVGRILTGGLGRWVDAELTSEYGLPPAATSYQPPVNDDGRGGTDHVGTPPAESNSQVVIAVGVAVAVVGFLVLART